MFKTGQLRHARDKYLKALKILDSAFDIETDEEVGIFPSFLCKSWSLQR